MAREGSCYGEVRQFNRTPQSSSPYIRKFDQISSPRLCHTELHPWRHKRMKVLSDGKDTNTVPWFKGVCAESKYKRDKSLPDVIDYSDPHSVSNLMEELDRGVYGSVCKDIEELRTKSFQMLNPLLALYPSLTNRRLDTGYSQLMNKQSSLLTSQEIVDLDDDCVVIDSPVVGYSKSICKSLAEDIEMENIKDGLQKYDNSQVVILDSDEEDSGKQSRTTQTSGDIIEASKYEIPQALKMEVPHNPDLDVGRFHEVHGDQRGNNKNMIQRGNNKNMIADTVLGTVLDENRKVQYQQVVLKKPIVENPVKDLAVIDAKNEVLTEEVKPLNAIREPEPEKDKGVYVGVQDDLSINKKGRQRDSDDGLGDIWWEMSLALECSKDATGDIAEKGEDEEGEDCDHSYLLKDDLGYVCRVCGVIKKSIETIFDFQWGKGSKTTRTHMSESRSTKGKEENEAAPFSGPSGSHNLPVVDIPVHPRHMKQMKAHQLEGFNFLVRNLISDDPGGCILAHAPGSGKTFMIISFIQSFLTKYPDARPLVVLPKPIVSTWRNEFMKWQVEDMPLYDFYSSNANTRKEQLDILRQWVENKGILFLGYKQFANIVSKNESSAIAVSCHDILLKVPNILIMDEGHTPRNEDTDVLSSLAKVQTPRKVVLSGTLFQNHVKEVFNILNLVRPKFLKSETSKAIRRRVMSRGQIGRKQVKAGIDAAFFDVVEETLQNDDNSKGKVAVIQDLREMTRNVLHYYKGDFLDELPGLVDFTVFVNLSPKQKRIVDSLKKMEKFKRTSIGTSVYVHPLLNEISANATNADKGCNFNENKVDDLINRMDIRDGVKAKFFLNILGLCASSGEKLLVFSQYLLPLKFLERLVVKAKGWSPGKETFMINGDTSDEDRELAMESFNNSSDAKVLFGSIKACGEGISLVGASRILVMDVHLNPSVTRQAVGRAFRPGQMRKVYVYRLVASDSAEEENHNTSFRKELISKMWFEWSEYCSNSYFDMEAVNVKDTDDEFWESPSLREDVIVVKKR
ncbi:Chromatin remodeling [Thalictrum thalictroides]|uniref:Chromatin remodeling n=1 Tax=Thalictrum thalictroides TaxID=46969 RepID=A0A7J6X2P6_THATH|nr:Chromatin remodeling [Thalictrum thalictroides]